MKQYNKLIGITIGIYLLLSILMGIICIRNEREEIRGYRVEANRIQQEIQNMVSSADEGRMEIKTIVEQWENPGYQWVTTIDFLPTTERKQERITSFYQESNDTKKVFLPMYQDTQLLGYLMVSYVGEERDWTPWILMEVGMLLMAVIVVVILLYLKRHLVMPFHRMNELSHELSKGNLKGEIKEDKNRYLGKFLWGMGQLKDELQVSRKRELELLKEKKTLLLSLSHDIKTPLNMIKLYGKALEENMYQTEEERQEVYQNIGEKTVQIENYVAEIVKASREEILHIQVEQQEFFLRDVMEKVRSVYGEKCQIRKCNLSVKPYQNRLFAGDANRLFEVLENIFENALKYGDGREIQVSFGEEEECQLIRVFNTGRTVTDQDFNHLFDSFFRGGNAEGRPGNGLGLYICREIMHKMGGEIYAEREKEGMAFVIVLPIL